MFKGLALQLKWRESAALEGMQRYLAHLRVQNPDLILRERSALLFSRQEGYTLRTMMPIHLRCIFEDARNLRSISLLEFMLLPYIVFRGLYKGVERRLPRYLGSRALISGNKVERTVMTGT
jgi:hypothetical protein